MIILPKLCVKRWEFDLRRASMNPPPYIVALPSLRIHPESRPPQVQCSPVDTPPPVICKVYDSSVIAYASALALVSEYSM